MQLRKIWFFIGCAAFGLTACDNPISTPSKSGELSRTQYAVYSCTHGIYDPAWSPDGSQIAFVSEVPVCDIYKLGSFGDTLRKVNRFYGYLTKNYSEVSPDEKFIIYSDYFEDVQVHRRNTFLYSTEQDSNFLVNDIIPASSALFKWSEDNRLIYFHFYTSTTTFINAITPEGVPVFSIPLDSTKEFSDYAVAPDQQSIAWACKPPNQQFWQIWLYTPATGQHKLLAADSTDYIHPVWSPDGSRIACQTYNYKTANRSLDVYSLTDQTYQSIVNNLAWYNWIMWANDGQTIYFSGYFLKKINEGIGVWSVSLADNEITFKYPVDEDHIFQLNPDGSIFLSSGIIYTRYLNSYSVGNKHVTCLTPGTTKELNHPTWSPDGATLVFSMDRDLCRIPAGGGDPERLRWYRTTTQSNPEFSPDGSLLAFDNGSAVYLITTSGEDERIITTKSYYKNPVWSPDGKQIACSYHEIDNDSLIIYDYADDKLTRAKAWPGKYYSISWSKPHPLLGDNILFSKLVYGGAGGNGYILQIRNIQTEQVYTLFGENGSLTKNKFFYIGACWAPDAETIAWIQRDGLTSNYSLNIARIFADIK